MHLLDTKATHCIQCIFKCYAFPGNHDNHDQKSDQKMYFLFSVQPFEMTIIYFIILLVKEMHNNYNI